MNRSKEIDSLKESVFEIAIEPKTVTAVDAEKQPLSLERGGQTHLLRAGIGTFLFNLQKYHPGFFPMATRWFSEDFPGAYLIERPVTNAVVSIHGDEANEYSNFTMTLPWLVYLVFPVSRTHFSARVFCRHEQIWDKDDSVFIPPLAGIDENGFLMTDATFEYKPSFLQSAIKEIEYFALALDASTVKQSALNLKFPEMFSGVETIQEKIACISELSPEDILYKVAFQEHSEVKTIKDLLDSRDKQFDFEADMYSFDNCLEALVTSVEQNIDEQSNQ